MHEAGHAAHFANVKQHTPLASQERAPTSVAYAETQSMFLDSLVSDAAWRAKYAKNAQGQVLPFEIIQQEIEATHPFAVFQLRAMLVVSYFEKALYELPDEQVTAETILQLATTMEDKIQGGPSPRPLLSVPHLVSDEASCYYHGYTLAEMCVHQTRAFFKERDGYIVDNPKVGPTLKAAYWECGNTRPFLELVQELTKSPLAGDSWVAMLNEPIADKIRREKQEYEQALSSTTNSTSTTTALSDDVDLNMTVRFVDGDTLIADSNQAGSILAACKQFEDFVAKRVAAGAASTTT
jgi:oligoendopeptidase F